MYAILPYAFPALGNLVAFWLILFRQHRPIHTMAWANLCASAGFGMAISVKVWCCTAEPSLWAMPLVFAPLEYWIRFGPAVALATAALWGWKKWSGRSRP